MVEQNEGQSHETCSQFFLLWVIFVELTPSLRRIDWLYRYYRVKRRKVIVKKTGGENENGK